MNEENIFVSICCLSYNHEKFINECLNGFVMQQTSFNFEVLIHDDASTDDTANIIREYVEKYPLIFKPIFQTENQYSKGGGISAKYNYPRAKGKYIALCEGDDYWIDPLKLQKQVDFLETNKDYSFCGHKSISLKNYVFTKIDLKILELNFEQLIFKNRLNTATLVFRSQSISNLPNIFNKSPAGDWLLQLFALKTGKGKVLDDYMSVYREHDNGLWSGLANVEKGEAGVKVLKIVKQIYNDPKSKRLINESIKKRRKDFNINEESIIKKSLCFFKNLKKYING